MSVEEYEAIRLIDYQGCTRAECSEYMSSPGRRRSSSQQRQKKLASALVEGRPLRIEGGSYQLCEGAAEHCPRHGCRKAALPEGEEQ